MKKIIELEGMKGECNTGQEEKEGISEFLLKFFLSHGNRYFNPSTRLKYGVKVEILLIKVKNIL